MRPLALMTISLALALGNVAAQDNGQATPQADGKPAAFVDLQGVTHHPLDTKDCKAVVLVFITNDCPISNYYPSQISAIANDFGGKSVRLFAIHVDPELTPAAAAEHAKEYGLTCPVLIDAKHTLAKAVGATVTPEAAVLTPDGKVAYLGRIDDTFADLGKRRVAPDQRDLRNALTQILAGKEVAVPRTKAIGCPIN